MPEFGENPSVRTVLVTARDVTERLKLLSQRDIAELRKVLEDDFPQDSSFEDIELEAAVEEPAGQYAERGGFRCHFRATNDEKRMTEQGKVLLFRAAGEILMNIAKHAEASAVHISIGRLEGIAYMVFEDDGKRFGVSGLDEAIRTHEGLGSFNIRERLPRVGGIFAVESQPGQRTKVTLVAPLGPINQVASGSEKS